MSFLDLRAEVLDRDLCANCGACVATCPQDLLTIDVDQPVPQLADGCRTDPAVACGSCTLCLDVCPGQHTGVAESELRLFDRTRTEDERWTGISTNTLIASARSQKVLDAASAGGAVTALLVAALRAGTIDAALVVGRDPDRPWVPAPRLVSTEDEIIECAQATYCITPNLQLLRDTPYERIAVVGLPCQIEAVNKMRGVSPMPPAVLRVAMTIEVACSSNTRREGTERLITDRLGLPLIDVSAMRYRDGDYPGEFTVRDLEGKRHTVPFHDLVTEFTKYKTFRCLACPDWWSGLADVSIADGDPNIFKTSRDGTAAEKTSMLLVRTEVGAAAVDTAIAGGLLGTRAAHFAPEDSLGLQRKRHRYERYRRKHADGVPDAPVPGDEVVGVLDDNEVIEQMSARP